MFVTVTILFPVRSSAVVSKVPFVSIETDVSGRLAMLEKGVRRCSSRNLWAQYIDWILCFTKELRYMLPRMAVAVPKKRTRKIERAAMTSKSVKPACGLEGVLFVFLCPLFIVVSLSRVLRHSSLIEV